MKLTKIKKICIVEGQPIYHLTIKNNRNFFGNNLLLHNCDYFSNPSNDGNIGICLINLSNETVKINKGDRIAQGIFEQFLVAESGFTTTDEERKGGIGSTN